MICGYSRINIEHPLNISQKNALYNLGVEKIYSDFSNDKHKRPELTSMLSSLRKGDTVVVWKLNQLGKTLGDLIDIIEKISDKNVSFISIQNNIDTSIDDGESLFKIFHDLKEFKSDIIIDRKTSRLIIPREHRAIVGRKYKLSEKNLNFAKIMLEKYTVTSVAEHFGVDRRTLRRSLDRCK